MTEERWHDLVGTIQDRFAEVTKGKKDLEDEVGTVEFIEFTSPAGQMRLECELRPRVTNIKTHGGRRGTSAGITKEYSPDEMMANILAFQKIDGQWKEIDASAFTS